MIEYIGYHGTDRERYKNIQKNGFKIERPQNQMPCDLGPGVYTFIQRPGFNLEDPKENAANYLKHVKPTYKQPVILEITSQFENEECILDMNDKENQAAFLKFKKDNLERIKLKFSSLSDGKMKRRGKGDGLILNLMILDSGHRIDAIIMDSYTPFDFKGYHQSNIPNGRELCLRSKKSIKCYNIC